MIYCETHGKIRGRKAQYCPICGGKTTTINLFPLLKLYVDKKGCYISTGVLCTTALLVAFCGPIISGVSGCNERTRIERQQKEQYRQAIAEVMPQTWSALYNAVKASSNDRYRATMIEEMVKSNPNPGPLSSEALKVILDTFDTDYYQSASYIIISKYVQQGEPKVEK